MTISASSVSAKLRAAGFGIVATRNREGIRVSRGALAGRVCVAVDLDRPGEARRTAALLEQWLVDNASAQGWSWSRHGGDSNLFTITHKPLTPPSPTYVAQKPLQPRAIHTPQADKARNLYLELRTASLALENCVRTGTAPAQADITAARTALEALIELAGGDQ